MIGAILLAIADIYLSGHNIGWHKVEFLPGMDGQNLAFIIITLGIGLGSGGIYWYISGKRHINE